MSSPTPYFQGLVTTVIQPFQPFLNTTNFMIHASGTADSLRSQPLFQLVQPFLNISLIFYIPLAYCGLYLLNMVAAELIMYYRVSRIESR
jgi:hypothetical protein